MLSLKDIQFLKIALPSYEHFRVKKDYGEKGYRLWAREKDKFGFEYFFTDGFNTEKECIEWLQRKPNYDIRNL